MRAADTQIRVGSGALLCFSAFFTVWQMGVIYFSGTALSLFGRTPMAVDQNIMLSVIASGYLSSMVAICLAPRRMVLVQRLVFSLALLAMLGMLLPLEAGVVCGLFYVSAFCCVFSIGGLAAVAVPLFTVETIWRDGIIGVAFSGICIALLQNDFVQFDFTVFLICSILLVAGLLAFQCHLPSRIGVPFAAKSSGRQKPLVPYLGVFMMVAFPTVFLLMATSIAETLPHGVSVMYLSAAVLALALHLIKVKVRRGGQSVRVYGAFFMLTPLGFACTILAAYIPALGLVACVFFGFSVALASMYLFFLAGAFSIYPSRFVSVQGTALGLILALVHAVVIEVFRSSTVILYCIHLLLSVVLMAAYYLLEPHFMYSWKQHMEAEPAAKGAADAGDAAAASRKSGRSAGIADCAVPLRQLSQQEQNLARLILAGYSESQIAREMNISLNTQKSYRKTLYTKLDIHSKRELFRLLED